MIKSTNYPDLRERNVLVTGGANGIGTAIVRAFHGQGARVFFCDLDANAGQALVEQLGANAYFKKLDLLKEREICRWIGQIGERWKRISVLVNNAASDPRIALADTTSAAWDRLFAGNLRAYFLTSRESVGHMPSNGASIINLASVTWHLAPANMAAYVATKGGVLGFTRSLARELGPRGIRVNAVSPGWIMTERQLRDYVTPSVKKLIRKSQCIPDLIQPAEIASVVLFLASDASRAITGQEILVDRGWAHS
jgi:NAD(P)-dependent dehydrogenase (short-subunit alcohol dehydrogenase family)